MTHSLTCERPPWPLQITVVACAVLILVMLSYWLLHFQHLSALVDTDTIARLFAAIAVADRGYFDQPDQLQLGMAGTLLWVSGPLYLALFFTWWKRSPLALPLALSVAAIGCYCAAISAWIGVLDGFPGTERTSSAILLLFLLSAGWFLIHFSLGVNAVRLWKNTLVPQQSTRDDSYGGSAFERKILIGLLIFFSVIALFIELPWLLTSFDLPQLDNLWQQIWSFYALADRGYYDQVSGFERGLESFQIFITQWPDLLLCWAIPQRKSYACVLQIIIGSYVAFSTVMYLMAKHLSGYALMPVHDLGAFLILYLFNLPWIIGNLYIAAHGAKTMLRQLATGLEGSHD